MHDPLAVAALSRPELLTWAPAHVDVVTGDDVGRGVAIADFLATGDAPAPNAQVATGVDADASRPTSSTGSPRTDDQPRAHSVRTHRRRCRNAPPMGVSAMLTLAPGQLTVAAPSSRGGTPAAVTDGGGGADMRRASSRRYARSTV